VEAKIQAISDIDTRVLGPLLEGLPRLGGYRILVISDHPTPCAIKTHSSEPVPFAVWPLPAGARASGAAGYTESAAAESDLFVEKGWTIMQKFLSGEL
jgi:2,3-bisphosphoglycerate-independent phosphoglycerate mutase